MDGNEDVSTSDYVAVNHATTHILQRLSLKQELFELWQGVQEFLASHKREVKGSTL